MRASLLLIFGASLAASPLQSQSIAPPPTSAAVAPLWLGNPDGRAGAARLAELLRQSALPGVDGLALAGDIDRALASGRPRLR
jgi:hypothetical protein